MMWSQGWRILKLGSLHITIRAFVAIHIMVKPWRLEYGIGMKKISFNCNDWHKASGMCDLKKKVRSAKPEGQDVGGFGDTIIYKARWQCGLWGGAGRLWGLERLSEWVRTKSRCNVNICELIHLGRKKKLLMRSGDCIQRDLMFLGMDHWSLTHKYCKQLGR